MQFFFKLDNLQFIPGDLTPKPSHLKGKQCAKPARIPGYPIAAPTSTSDIKTTTTAATAGVKTVEAATASSSMTGVVKVEQSDTRITFDPPSSTPTTGAIHRQLPSGAS